MKIVFTKAFEKEYKRVKDKKLAQSIISIIDEVYTAKNIHEITGIKKLENGKNAFRVRVGSYRIGLFIEKGIATFAIFEHRSSIYRKFP